MTERMKLMLVDDEERYLVTTQKLLTNKGCDVLTASSGPAALEQLNRHNVHVVFLDVKMPGMDGIETLREIKQLFPIVDVVMVTGHATVESAVDGMKCGAVDYLMKPCSPDDLLQKAREAFERRQKREEKIRAAQARSYVKSPRELVRDAES